MLQIFVLDIGKILNVSCRRYTSPQYTYAMDNKDYEMGNPFKLLAFTITNAKSYSCFEGG